MDDTRSTSSVRVLLVDDDRDFVRALMSSLVEDDRVEVVGTAHDGRTALALTKELRPDALLLDIQMPVMDGLETLRRLRRWRRRPAVVLLTGARDDHTLERGRRARAEAFLRKTVDADDVVPTLVVSSTMLKLQQAAAAL